MARKITGDDVTVVIPTIAGRTHLVERALASVKLQIVQPAEVIIELDGKRRGAWATRNRAVEKVKTKWIAFLDDDDELLPNHVRRLVAGANFSKADLIYTYAEFVGRADPLAVVINDQLIAEPINVPWGPDAEHSLRTFGNFIPVTNLVRTDAFRKVGGFPEPNTFGEVTSGDCEDYGLLLRLLDHGYTFYHVVGVRTWRYNVWGGNTGGRGE